MKRAYWALIIMFLVLGLNTLALALASESSEVLVSTDKDVYAIGETVEITVSMDPRIRCLCFEHEWEVRVERIENNGVVEKWCWKWKARANESGFRGKTIYWTPSEVGRYKVIAKLVTHNASASKMIEVIAGRRETVEYIYRTDEYDLKIIVPRYLVLSTPQQKVSNYIEVFLLKKVGTLSGLLTVSLERGIKVIISIPPTTPLWVFLDVDLNILGIPLYDLFQLKWPIPIPPLNLEEGDIGLYTSLIPAKTAEVQLEALPVGERHRICSYNLYVNIKPEYLATLGQLPVDRTGEVKGSISEEAESYKELYESLLRRYDVLREKYDALEDENRALKSKISILEGIVSQLRGEVSSLKNQVASLQQSLSHTEEALNEAKSKLMVTENELAWWRMFTLVVGIVAFVVGLITMHLIIKTRSAMPTTRLPSSAQ